MDDQGLTGPAFSCLGTLLPQTSSICGPSAEASGRARFSCLGTLLPQASSICRPSAEAFGRARFHASARSSPKLPRSAGQVPRLPGELAFMPRHASAPGFPDLRAQRRGFREISLACLGTLLPQASSICRLSAEASGRACFHGWVYTDLWVPTSTFATLTTRA